MRTLTTHFSPETPNNSPQRCTRLLYPAISNLRRLIHLCAQACGPTTRGADLWTRARIKFNRPPVDNPCSVLVRLSQAVAEGAPVPVVVADLFRGWEAHGVAFNGDGFVPGEFKVGGEEIGELVGGAVCGGGVVGGCLRGGRNGKSRKQMEYPELVKGPKLK